MGYDDFEGGGEGSLFFPTMIYGGCGKFQKKMLSREAGGGGAIFF